MPTELYFTAYGEPRPKGSGMALRSKSTGQPFYKPANPHTKPWQTTVAWEARTAAEAVGGFFGEAHVPVAIDVRCVFQRPKSVSAKRRPEHVTKPDADKLLRAIKDALTGVLYHDDGQVIECRVRKAYAAPGEPARAEVTVRILQEEAACCSGRSTTPAFAGF